MDDNLISGLVAVIGVIILVAVIIYIIAIIASAVVAVAGAGGLLWGSGTALINYIKSFKENMIDANKVTT